MARRERWKSVWVRWRDGAKHGAVGWKRGTSAGDWSWRKGIGRGRIVFLFGVFERFCAQARMFQDKHAPENGGERGVEPHQGPTQSL